MQCYAPKKGFEKKLDVQQTIPVERVKFQAVPRKEIPPRFC